MRHIFLAVATMLSTMVWGQDPEAKLSEIKERFTSAEGYKIEFLSTLEGEFYDMAGSIIIDKKGRYKMDLGDVIVIYDGDSQYNYMPSRSEVTIERPSNGGGYLTNPAQLFTLDGKDFNIVSAAQSFDGKSYSTLALTPKVKGGSGTEEITLYLDRDSNIKVITAKLESGQQFTLKIENLTIPYSAKESIFKFSKSDYKGIEIIDMR